MEMCFGPNMAMNLFCDNKVAIVISHKSLSNMIEQSM